MRKVFGWIIGISATAAMMTLSHEALTTFGIASERWHGGESSPTVEGGAVWLLSLLLGIRLGLFTATGSLQGGMSARSRIQCSAWIYGLFAFLGLSLVLHAIFGAGGDASGVLRGMLLMAGTAGLFVGLKRWYEHRLAALDLAADG